MVIERTNKEVIVRLSPNIDTEDLQKFLDYARYKELTANFKVSQTEIDDLVNQVKSSWKTNDKNTFQ